MGLLFLHSFLNCVSFIFFLQRKCNSEKNKINPFVTWEAVIQKKAEQGQLSWDNSGTQCIQHKLMETDHQKIREIFGKISTVLMQAC